MLENITEEDIVVWVDPLDGTSEYTQGFFFIQNFQLHFACIMFVYN